MDKSKTYIWLMAFFLLFGSFEVTYAKDRVEWSESATLKTKRMFNESGDLVYEENFHKSTGKRVGPVFDKRPKVKPLVKARQRAKGPETAKERLVTFQKTGSGFTLVKDSLVKVRLLKELSSRRTKKGESFYFEVVDPVIFEGKRVIPAKSRGTGTVSRVVRRGRWGRKGRITCDFDSVVTPGGQRVSLMMSKRARNRNKQEGYAAGASMIGLMALGPVGVVGGMFVKGRDVTIPKGAIFYLGVKEDVDVRPQAIRQDW